MDKTTIIGLVTGIVLILIAILLGSSLKVFWSMSSILIVVGGTIAAICVSYQGKDLKAIPKLLAQVFSIHPNDPEKMALNLLEFYKTSKKLTYVELPKQTEKYKNKFLTRGIDLLASGLQLEILLTTLSAEQQNIQRKHKIAKEIFMQMSKFSPAFGMVGTLIGLVQMLTNLEDPSTIGPKMAVALLTTFYGAVLANLCFVPMANKIQGKNEEETEVMKLVLVTIKSIRLNDSIALYRDKLRSYVPLDLIAKKHKVNL